jgi:cytidine deaminase
MTLKQLLDAARAARRHARCQYSGFAVGAALLSKDGQVFTGCNVENASYGLTICAERVALLKALSEGADEFTRIAIVTESEIPTPPCGPCRQLMWEYAGNIDVILGDLKKQTARYSLKQLFPCPFEAANLG